MIKPAQINEVQSDDVLSISANAGTMMNSLHRLSMVFSGTVNFLEALCMASIRLFTDRFANLGICLVLK